MLKKPSGFRNCKNNPGAAQNSPVKHERQYITRYPEITKDYN